MRFDLFVSGEPVAQGRPKFSTIGGHVRAVDPARSREFKHIVSVLARQRMLDLGIAPMSCPLKLTIHVFRVPPKSMGKKKGTEACERHTGIVTRPDLDNYIKLVSDALNGVVFLDDSQVVAIEADKRYSATPGIAVSVMEEME